jgi:hypothetical protein
VKEVKFISGWVSKVNREGRVWVRFEKEVKMQSRNMSAINETQMELSVKDGKEIEGWQVLEVQERGFLNEVRFKKPEELSSFARDLIQIKFVDQGLIIGNITGEVLSANYTIEGEIPK